MMKRMVIVVLTALVAALSASAQTTISLGGSVSNFSEVKNGAGASVMLGRMTKYGFWQAGVTVRRSVYANEFPYKQAEDGSLVPYEEIDYTAAERQSFRYIFSASYMARVIGNRRHSLNVYLGAGAFGGFEKSGVFKRYTVLDGGTVESKDVDNSSPVFGLFPELQAEAFLSGRLSFFVDAQYRFDFLSAEARHFPMLGIGFRVLL